MKCQSIEGNYAVYFYPGLLLLFISLTTVAYYLAYPGVDINADSPTYLSAAERLFVHPYQLLDPVRLPGYPLFLALIYAIAGHGNLAAVSYVHALFFILTAVEVYLLARHIFRRPLLAFIVALLFGTNITLLGYCKAIMSEGLAALLLTSLALAIVSFVQTLRLKTLCLVTILLLLLIFTRPEWLLLPPFLFLFLFMFAIKCKGNHKLFLFIGTMFVSLVIIYGSLGIYSEQNAVRNHYPGLTAVSSWNYIGKVLQYDMQDEVLPEQRVISRKLAACIVRIDRDPFHVLPCVPELSNDQYDTAAGAFALSIILHHPGEFLLKSLPLFISSLVDYHDVTYHTNVSGGMFGVPLAWLRAAHRASYWVNICLPFCIVGWLVCWARRMRWFGKGRWGEEVDKVDGVALAAVCLLVVYGVIVTTLAGYRADDYMRFHIVFDPLLILFVWGSILWGIFSLKQRLFPEASEQ